ncbi:MAG: DUF922 domain-containing protein [Flavobacteriaceae bacterium]
MGVLIRFWILAVISFTITGHSQEEEIRWSPEVRLKWSDFRGQARENSPIAAVTASGLSYRFSSLEDDGYYEVEYEVSTFFYPLKSWYQPHKCDDLVLSHEQLHFDIAELFARRMRRTIDNTRFTENVKAEINAIYVQTLKELEDFQDKYDMETNYSMNKAAQLKWNKQIQEALNQ